MLIVISEMVKYKIESNNTFIISSLSNIKYKNKEAQYIN